jgi:quercetin dioxygenase-like cupin family protein
MIDESNWEVIADGVRRRVLQDGEKLMMVQIQVSAGRDTPAHNHPHEQMTYILSGRMRFTIDGNSIDLSSGQSVRIPSNVVHGASALSDSTILDVFSPPREDFRR